MVSNYTNIRVMSLNGLKYSGTLHNTQAIDRGHSTPRNPPHKDHLRSSLLLLSSFDYSKGEYTYGWYSQVRGTMQCIT